MPWHTVFRATKVMSVAVGALIATSCSSDGGGQKVQAEVGHLFVWSGDADGGDSDFLAVIDAKRSSPTYGKVVASLPVGSKGIVPHHTEYEYFSGDTVFANGWAGNESFLFDLAAPRAPRVAARFKDVGGLSYPHSFARLPNGHVIATFQGRGGKYGAPGGLAEIDGSGRVIRVASSKTPDIPDDLNWPYSLAIDSGRGLAIVSIAEMGLDPTAELHQSRYVQLWSTSDLTLRATVALPDSGRHVHLDPAEPRVLNDGTIYVNTFSCGLYRLKDVDTTRPSAELVYDFSRLASNPHGDMGGCAVPVVYGKYWIQTVPGLPGLMVLDVSDPARPVEASRLILDPKRYAMPHWVAADRRGGRLVATGNRGSWVLIVNFDEATGKLSIDERFRDAGAAVPGVNFERRSWPHGEGGAAWVHGALFGR